jgi:hypothetical protein
MTIGSTIHQSNGDNDIYLVSWSENQPTGISEQQTATKLIGYPNPATSYINLEGKFESVKVKVNVYSVEGKLVLATETETAFDSRITLNTEELNPGTYIAVVEDSGVRSSVSFMIR